MSPVTRNTETERLLAEARALRAAHLADLVSRAMAPVLAAAAALRQALDNRARVRALSRLDRHTLVDVGLDHLVRPSANTAANENRPRHVA